MVLTISTEQSSRRRFSTWPAPLRRSNKLSLRLNTPSAKLAATLSSGTVTTGIFRTGRPAQVLHERLPSLRARNTSCHSDEVEAATHPRKASGRGQAFNSVEEFAGFFTGSFDCASLRSG